jgi:hypothetical protein
MALFALLICFATPLQAADWHVVFNGISHHFGTMKVPAGQRAVGTSKVQVDGRTLVRTRYEMSYKDYQFNEQNTGMGLQWDKKYNKKVVSYHGGFYKDSNSNMAYYAGANLAWRFKPVKRFHVDAGATLSIMKRQDILDGMPFPAILPVLSAGTNKTSVNMTFIPEVEGYTVPTLFFQMKYKISGKI